MSGAQWQEEYRQKLELALDRILPPMTGELYAEVIDAMRAVGDAMPAALRETGTGGLAATPTGQRIAQSLGRD